MYIGSLIDITGQRFNHLIVIQYVGKSHWLCKCDCGKETVVFTGHLKDGHTTSCGCHLNHIRANRQCHFKHGLRNHRIYRIWIGMKKRCYDRSDPKYYRYGGRGITICDDWLNNPKVFYDWAMRNGYKDDLTIDRINNDGNYEPNNCRWTTNLIQSHNRGLRSDNKSGFSGVNREKGKYDYWRASFIRNGKIIGRKMFRTKNEAIQYRKYLEDLYEKEGNHDITRECKS